MPTIYSYAILGGWSPAKSIGLEQAISRLRRQQFALSQVFPALAAWRVTQGIYNFHPVLQPVIESTELEGNLPVDVLYSMPEWCVYISTPNHRQFHHDDTYMQGFLAYLDWDTGTQKPKLRIIADNVSVLGILGTIHLNHDTIEGNIKAADPTVIQNYLDPGIKTNDIMTPAEAAQSFSPFINLLLYVCARNAEIRDSTGKECRPNNPLQTKTKRGARIFPPARPTIWDVGYRIGPLLQQSAQHAGGSNTKGTQAGPRAHIRRSHWHSYWVGPRPNQTIDLKWLAPIAVAVDEEHEIIPTFRAVTDEH